jgi:hypothetical protein
VNPVTVQLLNGAEKYRRSKQVEVCQLLNQAQAGGLGRSSLRERVMHALGARLGRGRLAAEKRGASSDTQLLGRATE